MNERIKELMEEAGIYENQYTAEMFAQLIVEECIDTAFHKGHPDLEFLLKHFGVEE